VNGYHYRWNDDGTVTQTVWSVDEPLEAMHGRVLAERLLDALPPEAQVLLRRLSPDSRLDQLHAKVFIMHDREDASVPYVQSRLLAGHLRPGQGEYDEFRFFAHVDPTAAVSPLVFVEDSACLASHMFQIVEILQGTAAVWKY